MGHARAEREKKERAATKSKDAKKRSTAKCSNTHSDGEDEAKSLPVSGSSHDVQESFVRAGKLHSPGDDVSLGLELLTL